MGFGMSIGRRAMLAAVALLAGLGAAGAEEIHVVSSGGFAAAYKALVPGFEARSGNTVVAAWGPSMGTTRDAVPARLARNEPIDVLIMVGYALGELIKQGKVVPDSRVDLAQSGIGVVVRQGAPLPDIATPDAVKATALAARAPAWIDPAAGGSSGIYMAGLFEHWGIAAALAPRAVLVKGGLVSDALLDGRADLAFQQLSELTGVPGVAVVGPLPAAIQSYTVYAGAVARQSGQAVAAQQALDWLAGPAAAPVLRMKGMEAP